MSQFLIGVEGLALLRSWVTGDPRIIEERVGEIEDLCRRFRDLSGNDAIEVRDVDVVSGYSSLAKTYDHIQNSLIETEGPVMRLLLDRLPRGRVVDTACGTGRHTEYLCGLGHDVTAVDVSDTMLHEARLKAPKAKFLQSDLRALPLATNSQDAAVCALALSHLPDLSPAVGELARVVRPGASVVLSDIHPFAAITGAHVVVSTGEGRFAVVRNHFHPYSHYFDAFRRYGLSVVACTGPPFEAAKYGRGGPLDSIREAAAMALDGLPFALIWHLRV